MRSYQDLLKASGYGSRPKDFDDLIGILDREVWQLSASFALPAAGGTALGMLLFTRIDPQLFRRIVFGLLLVAGILLLARG